MILREYDMVKNGKMKNGLELKEGESDAQTISNELLAYKQASPTIAEDLVVQRWHWTDVSAALGNHLSGLHDG